MGKAANLQRFVYPDRARQRVQRNMYGQLRERQEEYLGDLSRDDFEAIMQHIEGPYVEPGEAYGSEELARRLAGITYGAPRLTDELRVYRGSDPGRLIPERGYPLTTTIDPNRAESYAEGWIGPGPDNPGLVAEIQVPRGSPALALPSEDLIKRITGDYPMFGDEEELLLLNPTQPRGALQEMRRLTPGDPSQVPRPGRGALEMLRRYMQEPYSLPREGHEGYYLDYETRRYRPPYNRGGRVNGYA